MGLRICISNKFPGGSDAAENNQALACCGANQLEEGRQGDSDRRL